MPGLMWVGFIVASYAAVDWTVSTFFAYAWLDELSRPR